MSFDFNIFILIVIFFLPLIVNIYFLAAYSQKFRFLNKEIEKLKEKLTQVYNAPPFNSEAPNTTNNTQVSEENDGIHLGAQNSEALSAEMTTNNLDESLHNFRLSKVESLSNEALPQNHDNPVLPKSVSFASPDSQNNELESVNVDNVTRSPQTTKEDIEYNSEALSENTLNNDLSDNNNMIQTPLTNELTPSESKSLSATKKLSDSKFEEIDDSLNQNALEFGIQKPDSSWFSKLFVAANLPVNIGVLILLVGVGALLRYFFVNGIIELSIAFRLSLVAIVAIVVLIFGWKLRIKKRLFGLALQGGAIGTLISVVYASSKLYSLMPLTIAFLLTIGLLGFSVFLSLRQNAQSFMILTAFASYCAPQWLSSGSNNFVVLFSYYAILNLVFFFITYQRRWDAINLIAYLFSMIVGSYWGANYYENENFNIIQFFITLFFLFFVITPFIYTKKQLPPNNGPKWLWNLYQIHIYYLTVLTPLVVLLWQFNIFRTKYGFFNAEPYLAGYIIFMAVTFLALAFQIKKNSMNRLQSTVNLFLAIGLATRCIPLLFEAQVTGILFLAEGVLFFYFSKKQVKHSMLVLLNSLGGFIQVYGLYYFRDSLFGLIDNLTIFWPEHFYSNALSLDFIIGLCFFIALFLSSILLLKQLRLALIDNPASVNFSQVWLTVYANLSFIVFVCLVDNFISIFVTDTTVIIYNFVLPISLILGASVLLWNQRKIQLPILTRTLTLTVMLIGCLPILIGQKEGSFATDFTLSNSFTLLVALLVYVYFLKLKFEMSQLENLKNNMTSFKGGTLFLYYFIVILFIHHIIQPYDIIFMLTNESLEWFIPFFVTGCLSLASYLIKRLGFLRLPGTLHQLLIIGLSLVLSFLFLSQLFLSGDKITGAWIPLFNFVELPQLLTLLFLATVVYLFNNDELPKAFSRYKNLGIKLLLCTTVVMIQMVLIRAMWHWFIKPEVNWSFEALLSSPQIHALLTVYWTLLAVIFWFYGAHKKNRSIWLVGASFFCATLLKLLIFDRHYLSDVGGIVSFILYGLFCVVIGYFMPIPSENKLKEHNQKKV